MIAVFGAPVLAGAYRGKDIAQRATLTHAAALVPIAAGRFRRDADRALCKPSVDICDRYGWDDGTAIDCPRCLEIVGRLGSIVRLGAASEVS
jgi:hypothetical protein